MTSISCGISGFFTSGIFTSGISISAFFTTGISISGFFTSGFSISGSKPFSIYLSTSSLVIFPPIPVPFTFERLTPFSRAIRSARGETVPDGSNSGSGTNFRSGKGFDTGIGSPSIFLKTSFSVITPSGPVPATSSSEIPFSSASIRALGDAGILPPARDTSPISVPPVTSTLANGTSSRMTGTSSRTTGTSSRTTGTSFSSTGASFSASKDSSITAITSPTGTTSSMSFKTFKYPEDGASTSMLTLFVIISKIISPFSTYSPFFFFHSTMVPSSMVIPIFGITIFIVQSPLLHS